MAHMLTLTSKRVDEAANTMLYKAECSCGEWNAHNVAASVARELYDAHMQRVAGPEAQIAREAVQ
jgi:hypothetical protein